MWTYIYNLQYRYWVVTYSTLAQSPGSVNTWMLHRDLTLSCCWKFSSTLIFSSPAWCRCWPKPPVKDEFSGRTQTGGPHTHSEFQCWRLRDSDWSLESSSSSSHVGDICPSSRWSFTRPFLRSVTLIIVHCHSLTSAVHQAKQQHVNVNSIQLVKSLHCSHPERGWKWFSLSEWADKYDQMFHTGSGTCEKQV